jgi:hypothetical protein
MRIKVEGRVDFDRVLRILKDLYVRSGEGSTIHGLNIYLNIRDADGQLVEFTGKDGNPIEIVTYTEDRVQVPLKNASNTRKPAKPKVQKPKLSVVKNNPAEKENSAKAA